METLPLPQAFLLLRISRLSQFAYFCNCLL